jgi:hypothetical protein
MWSFLNKAERIVIVAISVNVVRVNYIDVLVKVYVEETTTRRFTVCLAGVIPVAFYLWIGKGPIDHVLHASFEKSGEIHDSVADEDSFEVDGCAGI